MFYISMSIELLSFVEWLQAVIDTFVSRAERIIIIIIRVRLASQEIPNEGVPGMISLLIAGREATY